MALKILLADDSMTAQNMGKKILTDAGYDVVAVSNGAAAVRKIAEVNPQICILDIYMPGYTGLEVCARIKNSAPTSRIPVLLTVGKMEPYKPEEGARVRADGVIVKPFEASELLRAVQRFAQKAVPARPAPAPSAAPANVEKTVRLTREQVREMMDPDNRGWRDNAADFGAAASKIEVPAEMASTPANLEEILADVTPSQKPDLSSPAVEPPADVPASVPAEETAAPAEATGSDEVKAETPIEAAGPALPGFVDYLKEEELTEKEEKTAPAETTAESSPEAAPAPAEPEADVKPETAPTSAEPVPAPDIAAAAEQPVADAVDAVASRYVLDATEKIDPSVLESALRESLAAEIERGKGRKKKHGKGQKHDKTSIAAMATVPEHAVSVAEPPVAMPVQPDAPAMAAQAAAAPAAGGFEISSPSVSEAEDADSSIGGVETKPIEMVASVVPVPPPPIESPKAPSQDPNLQVQASVEPEMVTEPALEPTSRAAEAADVAIKPEPNLTAYEAPPAPTATADSAASEPEEQEPVSQGEAQEAAASAQEESLHEGAGDITMALSALAIESALAGRTAETAPGAVSAREPGANGTRAWIAEEVAVEEAEIPVSLVEEMQSARSHQEMSAIAATPEASLRDDGNTPESKKPGQGGPSRFQEVTPNDELAAAMAAAFGGAMSSSDLARAEATQPISEEVRRFALGDAYHAKPKAGGSFGGAAIQDSEEGAQQFDDVRLAKAVSRALDRLKPQIVAEIIKELKTEE